MHHVAAAAAIINSHVAFFFLLYVACIRAVEQEDNLCLVYGQTQLLGFHSHLSRSAETRACAVIFPDFLWIFRTF